MLLLEGRELEVEISKFSPGVRFLLSTKLLLRFPTQGSSRTGLVVRVLSKDLFCCFSTSSLVLISASLSLVLRRWQNTNFIHFIFPKWFLNDLHFLNCRNSKWNVPLNHVLTLKIGQSRPTINNSGCKIVLNKYICVWGILN